MNLEAFKEHNYVPYSKGDALAVVKSKAGNYYPGVKVENIIYPLSISAEQNALFCCISEGHSPDILYTPRFEQPLMLFWKAEFDISVQPLDREKLSEDKVAEVVLPTKEDPIRLLTKLLKNAKVAESHFEVSALLQTEQGFFSGVNIECSAWDMGLCAERVAIAKALSYGSNKFKAIHVHAQKGEYNSPCGACRQVIMEHIAGGRVFLYHGNQTKSSHFINDLLPHSFHASTITKQSD